MTITTKQTTRAEWGTLFDDLTPQERNDVTVAMLQRIESKRMFESVEFLKKMPLALDGLNASRLMDVVEAARDEVWTWLMDNFPQAREKLEAYESLTVYYQDPSEKSFRDMSEAIEAICQAWGVSQFHVSVETSKTTVKGSPALSRPRRP